MMTTQQLLCFTLVGFLLGACASGAPGNYAEDGGTTSQEDGGGAYDALSFADAGGPADAPATCGEETCGDGIDNNCNALIDEGCGCEPSATAPCYAGSQATRGVGACADGVMTCNGQEEITVWGPCEGSVLPALEVCDNVGVDENCDGTVNEDCECTAGQTSACGSNVGACVAGLQACVGGVLGQCMGAVGPTVEVCDNIDNDCDGAIDEDLVASCGSNVGACTTGESVCEAGVWQPCLGGISSSVEVCDNQDNDCDGAIDEDVAVVCGSDVGACVSGLSQCVAGVFGACVGAVDSSPETCDNLDNDCDGLTDEGLTMVCGTNLGVCSTGLSTCVAGSYGACVGATGPNTAGPSESPAFCDGVDDDDCDGQVDDGCACTEGATSPCGTDVGECAFGTQTCVGGVMGACMGGAVAAPEICGNGLDEDCNGTADDGCGGTDPPIIMCGGSVTTQPLQTVTVSATGSDPDGGPVTYQWTVTMRPPGSTSQPGSPTSATTNFFLDLAGDYELTVTITDDENDTATCVVYLSAVPLQDLHIELIWDQAYGDADLHLLRPGLSVLTDWYAVGAPNAERDCFFGNKTASWPPNGGAGNATLDIDDTNGYGPENINIDTQPGDGAYHIGVAYFCSHSLGANPAPGDGPVNATVRVYCGGILADEYTFPLQQTGEFVHVADVTWPSCAGLSVLNSSWTSQIQPAGYTVPLHCVVACTGNSDCTPGEVCAANGQCALD